MFCATVSGGEECPVLKQHAPALLQDAQIAVARPLDAPPEDLDPPGRRAHQADDAFQQYRLAGAGTADQAHDLAAADEEVELLVHDVRPELRSKSGNPYDQVFRPLRTVAAAHHTPITE